jgi:hypothetical protein
MYLGLLNAHPHDTITKLLASCVFYLCLLELYFAFTIPFYVITAGNTTQLEVGHY